MVTTATSTPSLDVNSIVSQLMTVERQPISKLNAKEVSYQAKLSAYGSVKGAVSGFQSALQGLNSPSKFNALKATSSDSTVATAAAYSSAVAGTYSLSVTTLASSQKLVAGGTTSNTASIGAGATTTLTFDFGTISGGTLASGKYSGATFTSSGSGTKSVTIDSTNNSLQGIRDAINAAKIGVTATIVNDGGATPYRLVLTSDSSGVSNSMNITVSGDSAISDLLTNNPGSIAAVAGSSTGASAAKAAAGNPDAAAGTIAAGALVVTTSAGSASVGAITLPGGAVANGAAIATAISTALASLTGGAAANGSATADGGTGQITWNTGTNGANTLSMGSFAEDSAAATAAQTALVTNTGFSAAQLGTQAIGIQNMSQTAAAQNAVFTVDGVAVSKTSNTVSDVIQGVTLTLSKEASSASLTVARDTAGISSSISSFVKTYNDLTGTLQSVSAYDRETKKAATLQGDGMVRNLQSQMRGMLSTSVVGTSGALTMLADIGITFQKDGTLSINQSKLDSAMASNFSDVAGLFTKVGQATDSLVSFSGATTATKAGNYAVSVSTIATQGKAYGTVGATSTTIDGTNNSISVSIDGVSASATLTSGVYTAATLATEVQSKINSASALSSAGVSVAVTQSGGIFTVTSNRYGSASNVSMSGNGADNLFGGIAPTATAGVDVVGSIGGVASATGSGQILTASSGNPAGLSIVINGGALGARGTVNYSRGYADILNEWATSSLASDGSIAGATSGINRTIQDIGKRRSDLETRLIGIEKRYRAQFTALDVMLSGMNQTSTYLTQQLDQLAKM